MTLVYLYCVTRVCVSSCPPAAVEAIEFVYVSDSPIVPAGQAGALFLVAAVRASPTLYYINCE